MLEHGTETIVHRALGDERRARIVAELESSRRPLDASEIGRRVRLHANTVRWHVGVLADAGIVRSRPAPRRTPGRPRIVYELVRPSVPAGRDEYRLLATVLAELVARAPGGTEASESAGRSWGRALAADPQRGDGVDDERAIGAVVDLLAERGFAPQALGPHIEMHRCPFHDLAEANPEVVCAVHRGLISGALAELGSNLRVEELEIFPRPGVCVARLTPSG